MERKVWYTYGGERQEGPFTLDEIREKRRTGAVSDDHFVWKEGLPDWVRFAEALGAPVRAAERVESAAHAPRAATDRTAPDEAPKIAVSHRLWAAGGAAGLFFLWRLAAGDALPWAETIGGAGLAVQGVRMRTESAIGWGVEKAPIRFSLLWAFAGASTPLGRLLHLAGLLLLQEGVLTLLFG